MIEYLGAELTEALKETSNTDNLAVAEEANVDEAITAESKAINEMENYPKYEKNTKSYEEKMNVDIENINTIEKINKVYTKKWRTIYEVIQPDFLRKLTSFQMILQKCKDNSNEAQFLPLEVKNNINQMAMGKLLYAQVVVLCRNNLKFTEANKNRNKAKFKFQGQSARSQRWFDLYFGWIEVNFSTRKPDFCRKIFQIHDNTQDTKSFKIFQVPIGNSKCVEIFKFHSDAPMLKYFQKSLNICCFSILLSAFYRNKQTKSGNAILFRL